MNAKAEYRYNQQTGIVQWTDKADEFDQISIKGTRWVDSVGNTYHKAYISGLKAGQWVDIGETITDSGYGEHYVITAGEWLTNNGYLADSLNSNGYCLGWHVCKGLGIERYAQDVKRKRDM